VLQWCVHGIVQYTLMQIGHISCKLLTVQRPLISCMLMFTTFYCTCLSLCIRADTGRAAACSDQRFCQRLTNSWRTVILTVIPTVILTVDQRSYYHTKGFPYAATAALCMQHNCQSDTMQSKQCYTHSTSHK
jgi:hypothetical protein